VQSVVKRIAGACPELGRHLERAVRTGVVCVYAPDPAFRVEWRLD
jgi:non-specific serine/threonine protein kinase